MLHGDVQEKISYFPKNGEFLGNPAPMNNAQKNQIPLNQQVYIAIVDTEYKPSPLQCALKKEWIDEISSLPYVDGIEFYSNASYYNPECNVHTVSFPKQSSIYYLTQDSTCNVMKEIMSLFLNRSTAGNLIIVTDATFIVAENFKDYFRADNPKMLLSEPSNLRSHKSQWTNDPINTLQWRGHCTGIRDYFESFVQNSGVLLSRKVASTIVEESTYSIACKIEIPGFEALSHSMSKHDLYPIFSHEPKFLGYPFKTKEDYNALITANFDSIAECPPDRYESFRVCYGLSYPLNKIIFWGASGNFIDKLTFIQNAKKWLNNLPNDIGFKYDTYTTELCKNPKHYI